MGNEAKKGARAGEGLHSGFGLCLEGYGEHWQGDAQGFVLF